jgi:uncharacterized membrane protein
MDRTDDIQPPFPQLKSLGQLDAHHRFFVGLLVAVVAYFAVPHSWHWPTRAIVTWNAYSLTLIALAWVTIVSANPNEVARTAVLQDTGRRMIFVFVIIAAVASVFAVAFELGTAKGLDKAHLVGHIAFSLLTVFSSWVLVHTVFALRYAHNYYGLVGGEQARCGLNFPDEDHPDYLDFAYFSFVIGMTSQVSDVSISARGLRRLALLHGLISFGFNAAILGLSINIVSGLFS